MLNFFMTALTDLFQDGDLEVLAHAMHGTYIAASSQGCIESS